MNSDSFPSSSPTSASSASFTSSRASTSSASRTPAAHSDLNSARVFAAPLAFLAIAASSSSSSSAKDTTFLPSRASFGASSSLSPPPLGKTVARGTSDFDFAFWPSSRTRATSSAVDPGSCVAMASSSSVSTSSNAGRFSRRIVSGGRESECEAKLRRRCYKVADSGVLCYFQVMIALKNSS